MSIKCKQSSAKQFSQQRITKTTENDSNLEQSCLLHPEQELESFWFSTLSAGKQYNVSALCHDGYFSDRQKAEE